MSKLSELLDAHYSSSVNKYACGGDFGSYEKLAEVETAIEEHISEAMYLALEHYVDSLALQDSPGWDGGEKEWEALIKEWSNLD